jgi:hypothetical protein
MAYTVKRVHLDGFEEYIFDHMHNSYWLFTTSKQKRKTFLYKSCAITVANKLTASQLNRSVHSPYYIYQVERCLNVENIYVASTERVVGSL